MTRVCPSFRRLATRCTGNLQRRPTDAQQLLRLFERRCSLRKRIILYTVGCITAIICVIAGLSIHNIRSSASHAREEITRLTAENRQNKQQVTGLNDSLNHVNQRMGEASARLDSIKKYNALKASRLEEGKSKLLAILIRHDKPISNIDPKETQKIYDCIKQVQDEILSTIEAYHSSLSKTALTPTDRESIRDEMYNYYLLECDKYFKKWIERVKSGVIKE